jgi:hypothetical protein
LGNATRVNLRFAAGELFGTGDLASWTRGALYFGRVQGRRQSIVGRRFANSATSTSFANKFNLFSMAYSGRNQIPLRRTSTAKYVHSHFSVSVAAERDDRNEG